MQKLGPLLLPLMAIPLLWLLLRDGPPAARTPSPVAEGNTGVPHDTAPVPVSAVVRNAAPPAVSGPMPPVPRTTAELNSFADGPLSLPDKMRVLMELMQNGPPDQAKAAAIRAIFIVKNKDFAAHLQPLVLQAKVKPEAMEVLSLNLYERPLDVQLPAWAQILEQPNHPLAAAAADGLEFHLKEKAAARGPALAQAIKECLTGEGPR